MSVIVLRKKKQEKKLYFKAHVHKIKFTRTMESFQRALLFCFFKQKRAYIWSFVLPYPEFVCYIRKSLSIYDSLPENKCTQIKLNVLKKFP